MSSQPDKTRRDQPAEAGYNTGGRSCNTAVTIVRRVVLQVCNSARRAPGCGTHRERRAQGCDTCRRSTSGAAPHRSAAPTHRCARRIRADRTIGGPAADRRVRAWPPAPAARAHRAPPPRLPPGGTFAARRAQGCGTFHARCAARSARHSHAHGGGIGVPDVAARHARITGTTRAAHATVQHATHARVGGELTRQK